MSVESPILTVCLPSNVFTDAPQQILSTTSHDSILATQPDYTYFLSKRIGIKSVLPSFFQPVAMAESSNSLIHPSGHEMYYQSSSL